MITEYWNRTNAFSFEDWSSAIKLTLMINLECNKILYTCYERKKIAIYNLLI